MPLSRRSLLAATAGLALAPGIARAAGGQKTLRLQSRVVEVAGKPATRYGVSQPSGDRGLTLDEGETFDVRLENKLDVLSGLHWHGLNPPWRRGRRALHIRAADRTGQVGRLQVSRPACRHALDAFAFRFAGTEPAGRPPDRAREQRDQKRTPGSGDPARRFLLDQALDAVRRAAQAQARHEHGRRRHEHVGQRRDDHGRRDDGWREGRPERHHLRCLPRQ